MNMSSTKSIVLAAALCVSGLVAFFAVRERAAQEPAVKENVSSASTPRATRVVAPRPAGQTNLEARPLLQTAEYYHRVRISPDRIEIESEEFVPGSNDKWEETTYGYSASYRIDVAACRDSREIYVAGMTPGGLDVIERWTSQTIKGARFLKITPSSAPYGTPSPALPAYEVGIEGGVYVPVASRPSMPRQTRVELYRGAEFGGVVDLAVDPEGRFVIVVATNPPAVYRLDNAAGSTPVLLYSLSALPDLQEAKSIYRRQQVGGARCYIIECRAIATSDIGKIVLVDSDNDGSVDSTSALTDAAFATAFPSSDWVAGFVSF
jgi:hypothetical protein